MKPNFLKVTPLEKDNHELKKLRLDRLNSRHKSIFLKYLNVKEWVDTEEVQALMAMELNTISVRQSATTWNSDMQRWVENVKNKFSEYIRTKCPTSFSSEEKALIQQLKDEKTYISPTVAELSCILDHLEIAGDSPRLWATLSLELEVENSQRTETYWKKNFSRISSELLIKQQILQRLASHQIEISSKVLELTPLELRLSIFVKPLEKINIDNDSTFNCRVCLQFSDRMSYIFEEAHNEMTLAEKMCRCANVSMIVKDDGLPQNICSSCLQLLNSAYTFKTLCEKSDQELRNIDQNQVKEELNEYCASVLDDAIQNDLSDNELKMNDNEIMISDDEFDQNDDALPLDNEMPMNDQSSSASQVSQSQNHQYYVRVPFPEQEYDGEVKTEENCTEIAEEPTSVPTDDGPVDDVKHSVRKLSSGVNLQCETCGRICSSSRTLRIHLQSHSALKNFKCKECSKDFKTRLALTIHMRMHTGERPYICEACGKAFKTVSAVNNHRAIHSIVKEFQCKQCSYRACTKANLNIHERTHSGVQPYACRFCALRFSTASNMHKHIRNIHEKLKTHKCDQCDRSFFTRESARKHMVTHTGLRPYTCSLCNMSYGWYNGLQKHMKMIHPGIKMPTEKSFFVKSEQI